MAKAIDYLQKFKNAGLLSETVWNQKVFHILNTGAEVIFPAKIISELRDLYDPRVEKGGFVLFRPYRRNGTTVLTAEKVEQIDNISDCPWQEYVINTPTHKKKEKSAYDSGLLPLAFHTHPSAAIGPFQEFMRFFHNLNTSDADKLVSYNNPFQAEGMNILLPDILVVNKGTDKMLFIGVYNGLITPLDFESSRKARAEKGMTKFFNGISGWADTDGKKAMLAIGGLLLLFGVVRYYKVALPVVAAAAFVAPVISLSDSEENFYLGIAGFSDFRILIPRVTPAILEENEKLLQQSIENFKKRNNK